MSSPLWFFFSLCGEGTDDDVVLTIFEDGDQVLSSIDFCAVLYTRDTSGWDSLLMIRIEGRGRHGRKNLKIQCDGSMTSNGTMSHLFNGRVGSFAIFSLCGNDADVDVGITIFDTDGRSSSGFQPQ